MNTALQQSVPASQLKLGIRRWIAKSLLFLVLLGLALFGSAGQIGWLLGWGHLALMAVIFTANGLVLILHSPDLILERSQMREGTKPWDRWLAPTVALFGPLAIVVAAGLEFRAARLVPFPPGLIWTGYAVAMAGSLFTTWAMASNRFFSGTVRLQTERDQQVIQTGPYRWVRHPGYLGGCLYNAVVSLTLGSLWGFIPAGLILIALIIRTALEDDTLKVELPGYREYAQRVPYRLVPLIW